MINRRTVTEYLPRKDPTRRQNASPYQRLHKLTRKRWLDGLERPIDLVPALAIPKSTSSPRDLLRSRSVTTGFVPFEGKPIKWSILGGIEREGAILKHCRAVVVVGHSAEMATLDYWITRGQRASDKYTSFA